MNNTEISRNVNRLIDPFICLQNEKKCAKIYKKNSNAVVKSFPSDVSIKKINQAIIWKHKAKTVVCQMVITNIQKIRGHIHQINLENESNKIQSVFLFATTDVALINRSSQKLSSLDA